MRSEQDVTEAAAKIVESLQKWDSKITVTQRALLNGMVVALSWTARKGGESMTKLLDGTFDKEMENGDKMAPVKRAAESMRGALNGKPWLMCVGFGEVGSKSTIFIYRRYATSETEKFVEKGWAGFDVKVVDHSSDPKNEQVL